MAGTTYPKRPPKSPREYSYYRCHNYSSMGKRVCVGNGVEKEKIEAFVLEEVKKHAKLHFEEREARKMLERNRQGSSQDRLRRIEEQIKGVENRKIRLISLFEDGSVEKNLLIKRNDSLTGELDRLNLLKDKLLAETNPREKDKRTSLLQEINTLNGDIFSLTKEVKKDLLRQLIRRVTIARDGRVEIEMYEL